MQILVRVAIRNVRSVSADVGKGSNRSAMRVGLVAPKSFPKGIQNVSTFTPASVGVSGA